MTILAQFYNLLFLFLLFRPVNSLTRRSYHTAAYINDKIYFLGGMTETSEYTNDFFYLDVSVPFNIDSLPFSSPSSLSISLPNHRKAMSTVCDDNTIFYFGGQIQNSIVYNYAFKFDTIWKPITNNAPRPRKWVAGTCYKGKVYMLGGSNDISQNSTLFSSELDIADISNTDQPNWGSEIIPFQSRDIATATLLPDGRIVYLGGNHDDSGRNYASMTEIPIYDTNVGVWSIMLTSGYQPKARGLHTAVLTNDGRIIVYGGEVGFNPNTRDGSSTPATDPLIVLDITTSPFKWSQHSIPPPSFSRAVYRGHTSTLVDDYMFVAFGSSSGRDNGSDLSDEISILDVSDKNNYKWVTNFTPKPPAPSAVPSAVPAAVSPSPPPLLPLPPPSSHGKSKIGYAVSGVIVSSLVITTLIILMYRKYCRVSITSIPTPGTESTENLVRPYSFVQSVKILNNKINFL